MKLADLNPCFLTWGLPRAHIEFDCPLCGSDHRIPVALNQDVTTQGANGAKRWAFTGIPGDWDSFSIIPSVDLKERCHWHGSVTNGEVV